MVVDLRFSRTPLTDQPLRLVFGEGGGEQPDRDPVEVDGEGVLPNIVGTGKIGFGSSINGDAFLPGITGEGSVQFQVRVPRPVARSHDARFQQAKKFQAPVEVAFQQSDPLSAPHKIRWRDAAPLHTPREVRWQQSTPMHRPTEARWRDAVPADGRPVDVRYQDALRTARPSIDSRYQDATPLFGNGASIRYQEALRTARPSLDSRYQDAIPMLPSIGVKFNNGRLLDRFTDSRYQDAIKPPPGIYIRPPEVPDPCYIPPPGGAVELVFKAPWTNDTHFVFVCERHGDVEPPGDTIVIPVREVYVIINTATLTRVDGNIPIVNFGISFSIDADSWTWQFSAVLPADQLANIQPGMDGDLVIVQTEINGVFYRMLIESVARERVFGEWGLRVSGRGINAVLDVPYSPILTFGNDSELSAAQLMDLVLTDNGVPMPWTVDWGLEDWPVPGGVWTHTGSRMSALAQIAAAGGGYLQPDKVDQNLIVLPRYPVAPWKWASDVTPDYEVPDAFAERDTVEWIDKPKYNRVFVSGTTGGVLRRVTREGTDGGIIAQPVVDPLITDGIAGRQRGLSVLGDSGRQARVTITTPVHSLTGLILPGKFVRYMEGATPRLGLVRGMSVNVGAAGNGALEIMQSLTMETHLE